MCEKCENRFENETEVMIHIRNVHYKDVRKMFASDAIEHLEADQEYHRWLNAITYVKKDKDLIRELKKSNKVLIKRVNEESKDTFKKVSEKRGIIETERVIYSEDGSTKMGVVKEQFAKVTKRKAIDAENIDPDNQKRSASDQRHQTEKVQNVLETSVLPVLDCWTWLLSKTKVLGKTFCQLLTLLTFFWHPGME